MPAMLKNACNTETPRKYASIKIRKEIAELTRIYCVLSNRTMSEFASNILETELETFKKKLDCMKQIS